MKYKYRSLLNRIDIFNPNNGRSIDISLKNIFGEEVFTTIGKNTKKSQLLNNVVASLQLCAELAKYNVLNLEEIANRIKESIQLYKNGKLNIIERANPIKKYCVTVADDMNKELLMNAYNLFNLYYSYKEEEIVLGYNFICSKIGVYNFDFNEVLPNCDIIKYKNKEQ